MTRPIVCGIDLGTTNSVIAFLKDGAPEAIPVEEGSAILPSIVSFDPLSDSQWVGQQAKNRRAAFPSETVGSIKRIMGKDTAIGIGSRSYSPPEISSRILRCLTDRASERLGQRVEKVVITVPAYFDDAQRRATIRAGELAGLEVVRIVNEPTAAALVYDHVPEEDGPQSPYVLVYDLGGGTFDVSVLEIKGEIKEVLASNGDTSLGGDDFDNRLKDYLLDQLKQQAGKKPIKEDIGLRVRLLDIAERAKIALSDQPFVRVHEVAVTMVDGQPLSLDFDLSRELFQSITVDLIDRTMEKVKEALNEAHIEAEEVGKLILVGGATRMPAVYEALSELFEQSVTHSIDPDLCVALGAAIQGGLITGDSVGQILLDVTAHSLGLKTIDTVDPVTGDADYFSTIIRRNTRIPVSRAEVYLTIGDGQDGIQVEVFQGESPSCLENSLIGSFYFRLKPAPANAQVIVEFAYDREGIVRVCVNQKGYENSKEVTLDIRNCRVEDPEAGGMTQTPVNYIAEKARRLAANPGLPRSLREQLLDVAGGYEAAIRSGEDEDRVDEVEGLLLELIDQVEDRLESSE